MLNMALRINTMSKTSVVAGPASDDADYVIEAAILKHRRSHPHPARHSAPSPNGIFSANTSPPMFSARSPHGRPSAATAAPHDNSSATAAPMPDVNMRSGPLRSAFRTGAVNRSASMPPSPGPPTVVTGGAAAPVPSYSAVPHSSADGHLIHTPAAVRTRCDPESGNPAGRTRARED